MLFLQGLSSNAFDAKNTWLFPELSVQAEAHLGAFSPPVRDSRRAVREAKASDDRVVALPDDQDRAAEVVHLNVRRHVGGEGVGPARRRLAGLRRAGYRQ